MRFITFAFVASKLLATASATWICPSTHGTADNCLLNDVPIISEWGDTDLLIYNIAGARIIYDGQTVTWSEQEGCEGARVSVDADVLETLEYSYALKVQMKVEEKLWNDVWNL